MRRPIPGPSVRTSEASGRASVASQNPDRRTILASVGALPFASPARQDPTDSRLLTNLISRMATTADLNGHGPYALVIDTGAQRTALAADLAAALGLPAGPEVLVHGVTQAQRTPSVRLDRLTVVGRRFRNLTCPVFAREDLGADGLLGLDVLSHTRLNLDLVTRRVGIAPSGREDPTVGSAMSGRSSRIQRRPERRGRFGQLLLSQASVNGVVVDAFIDTGSQWSLGNAAAFAALGARPDGGEDPEIEVYGVTGQSRRARLRRVDRVVLAERDLGAVELLFADLHVFRALGLDARPALLIGADLLGRFRTVILDYGRGQISLSGLRPSRITANSVSRGGE